jgi:hypothetical protein
MHPSVKTLFWTAIVLLVYGYLCRVIHLYFFWESKMIGWVLLFVALIFFLIDKQRRDKRAGKKTLGYKIGIGVCLFIFFGGGIVWLLVPYSDAYQAGKKLVMQNPDITRQVGEIRTVILVPYGEEFEMSSADRGETAGNAEFQLLVHGTRKNADINLSLRKTFKTEWTLVAYSIDD